jgi:hypothetical protein
MAKKPESKFGQKLMKATADKIHWTRIESWALPGVPDLHGCYAGVSFWLELKESPLLNVKFGMTIRQIGLRPHQIQWQMMYSHHGGKVFNLVHRPHLKTVQLYTHATLAEEPLSPILEEDDDVRGLKTVVDHIIELAK